VSGFYSVNAFCIRWLGGMPYRRQGLGDISPELVLGGEGGLDTVLILCYDTVMADQVLYKDIVSCDTDLPEGRQLIVLQYYQYIGL